MKVNTSRQRERLQIVLQYRVQPGIFSPSPFIKDTPNHYQRDTEMTCSRRLRNTRINHCKNFRFLFRREQLRTAKDNSPLDCSHLTRDSTFTSD